MTGTSLLLFIFFAAVFLGLAINYSRKRPRERTVGESSGHDMGWVLLGSSDAGGSDCSPGDAGCDAGGGGDGGGGGGGGD